VLARSVNKHCDVPELVPKIAKQISKHFMIQVFQDDRIGRCTARVAKIPGACKAFCSKCLSLVVFLPPISLSTKIKHYGGDLGGVLSWKASWGELAPGWHPSAFT
jgi:hypothetical protein